MSNDHKTTHHGSLELDADAEKLAAMGADPGPTFDDLEDVPFEIIPAPGERRRLTIRKKEQP